MAKRGLLAVVAAGITTLLIGAFALIVYKALSSPNRTTILPVAPAPLKTDLSPSVPPAAAIPVNRQPAVAARSTSAVISAKEIADLAHQLRDPDPSARDDAIGHLRTLAISNQRSLAMGIPQWAQPLVDLKRYQDVKNFASIAIAERAFDSQIVESSQRARVLSFLQEGDFASALVEGKAYYNVSAIGATPEAIDMIAQAWEQTADAQSAAQFVAEQAQSIVESRENTAPDAGQNTRLKSIPPLPTYASAIQTLQSHTNKTGGYSYSGLMALGNLLLLSDRSDEAKSYFEDACRASGANIRMTREALEGIARAIRSGDCALGRSCAYLSSIAEDPSGVAETLSVSGVPSPTNLATAARQLTQGLPKISQQIVASAGKRLDMPNPTADPISLSLHPSLAVPPKPARGSPAPAPLPAPLASSLTLETSRRFIMSMCTDLRGNIWLGTEGGGVQKFVASAPPSQQWIQFTTNDGLGDDNGYAIACDRLGRIWAGHLNHGVSVYNGAQWQNYEMIAGLSRPDSLAGPLGQRVSHIAVCPIDGDVWIATDAGLSRCSESKSVWTYYSNANGLPSQHISSIAFDKNGDLYVATQCDGILMSARSGNYASWRQTSAEEDEPAVGYGSGLPTNLINDICVANDGTVFAATNAGLAWTKDHGLSWQFARGADWIAKARGRFGGISTPLVQGNHPALSEDYCTCLAEDAKGQLWVGHRKTAPECWTAPTLENTIGQTPAYVRAMVPFNGQMMDGAYGQGCIFAHSSLATSNTGSANVMTAQASFPAPQSLAFPLGAPAPTAANFNDYLQSLSQIRPAQLRPGQLVAIDDDWHTQGSWLGRYGASWAMLLGMGATDDSGNQNLSWIYNPLNTHIRSTIRVGRNSGPLEGPRFWLAQASTADVRALEVPIQFKDASLEIPATGAPRRQAEVDDHGETYAPALDGPNLYIRLYIPPGLFRISLYCVNDDGHTPRNSCRDNLITIHTALLPGNAGPSNIDADAQQNDLSLIHLRQVDFWHGVYKRFVVRGPSMVKIDMNRSHSHNTILSGIFADSLAEADGNPSSTAIPASFVLKPPMSAYVSLLDSWQSETRWGEAFHPAVDTDEAAARCVSILDQMRGFNGGWFHAASQPGWTMALRYLSAQRQSHPSAPNPQSLRNWAVCCDALCLFAQRDASLQALGISPERAVILQQR